MSNASSKDNVVIVTDASRYAPSTMTAETCARHIVRGAAKRQREVYMTTRGKIGQWAKLIAPEVIGQIALRATEKGG